MTENEHVPVFETPELSKEDRIQILKRCHKIEQQVIRKFLQRILKKYRFLGTVAGYFFATDFMQKMFFENITFRRIVEYFRYKRLLSNMNANGKA